MEVDYHFVRERVLCRDLQVKYIAIGDQLANIFTKSLPTACFCFLKSKIMVSIAPMILMRDVKGSNSSEGQAQKTEEEDEQRLLANG